MAVDPVEHTEDAETVDKQPAGGRSRPPDVPGAENALTRAEARAGRADLPEAPEPAVDDQPPAERTPEGGWRWKGLELSPEDNAIAGRAIEARRAAEGRDSNGDYGDHGLTPQMRRVESELPFGELAADTEKYALKGEDRFKEKLAQGIAFRPDRATEELAAKLHDGIRYTFVFPFEKYTQGVHNAQEKLREHGYELHKRNPGWGSAEYKGVNSRWSEPGGSMLFEVQFHTPESLEGKQKTHPAYMTLNSPISSNEDKAAARKYQQEITASIPIPEGAEEIQPYTRGADGER